MGIGGDNSRSSADPKACAGSSGAVTEVRTPVATPQLGRRNREPQGSRFSGYHEGITSRLARRGWVRRRVLVAGRTAGGFKALDHTLRARHRGRSGQHSEKKCGHPHEKLLSLYNPSAHAEACLGHRVSVDFERLMLDRYPLTVSQLRQAKEELAAMQQRAEEISQLMTAGYGRLGPAGHSSRRTQCRDSTPAMGIGPQRRE